MNTIIPVSQRRNIRELHLEPTDVCQAACALCSRELDPDFKKHLQHHLTVDQINQHFDNTSIAKLTKMFMCGLYGDPAAGKYTMDIYQHFRHVNPEIALGMNTNGALQSAGWWNTLGTILNRQRDYVVFSIDGLENTNAIYRKNVSWSKLMTNAKTYINAGGRAHWDMLVYEHNEHQVQECEQLARDMGFFWFRAKISNRRLIGDLKRPTTWAIPEPKTGSIDCFALSEQSAYIDSQGRLSPCCILGNRQKDFVGFDQDFEQIQKSWNTPECNTLCKSNCSSDNVITTSKNQWQYVTELRQ
jgi:sulfatase maturation enzyme AslB (radical SAM superfamily)